jgi:ribosomal protein S18 acetylase RimI-like enzyme
MSSGVGDVAVSQMGVTTATEATAIVPVQIRRATPRDGWAIADLLVREFRLYPAGQPWLLPWVRLVIQADLQSRFTASRYACLVAINGAQQIVGTVEVGYRAALPWQWSPVPYPYLSNLAVRSTDRHQGIAQQLIAASETLVQEWQGTDLYLHVMADNLGARQLYLKRGYLIHHAQDEWWATVWGNAPRLFLHKRLAPWNPQNLAQNS